MDAGVYTITCRSTGWQYVGGSRHSLRSRFRTHRSTLRHGRGALRLQAAWDMQGEADFVFRPLLICRPEDVRLYEDIAIQALKPALNMAPTSRSVRGLRYGRVFREHCAARNKRLWAQGVFANSPKTPVRQRYLVHGEMLSMKELAARYGIPWTTIQSRIKQGVRGDALVASAKKGGFRYDGWAPAKRHLVHGEQLTAKQIAAKYGLGTNTVQDRVRRGVTGDALAAPPFSLVQRLRRRKK